MDSNEERLVRLETLAAEQERVIVDLSAQLADQWTTIGRLEKRLDQLRERFVAIEEQAAPDVPVTRPPHW